MYTILPLNVSTSLSELARLSAFSARRDADVGVCCSPRMITDGSLLGERRVSFCKSGDPAVVAAGGDEVDMSDDDLWLGKELGVKGDVDLI